MLVSFPLCLVCYCSSSDLSVFTATSAYTTVVMKYSTRPYIRIFRSEISIVINYTHFLTSQPQIPQTHALTTNKLTPFRTTTHTNKQLQLKKIQTRSQTYAHTHIYAHWRTLTLTYNAYTHNLIRTHIIYMHTRVITNSLTSIKYPMKPSKADEQ